MEWVFTDPVKNFIGHGFLAVDFFFCLSGFVVGYAYDDRIRKMGVKGIFQVEADKIAPFSCFGFCIGIIGFSFGSLCITHCLRRRQTPFAVCLFAFSYSASPDGGAFF
jgi:hypothetical protein